MTISNIIFLLIAGIIAISKTIDKHNKKVMQQPNRENDTDIILSDDISGEIPIPFQNTQPIEAPTYKHTTAANLTFATNKEGERAINSPKTPKNSPKIDSKPQNESQFDLKQAVIYSEILEPKFKEYE